MHARFARRPDQRITLPTAQCSGHPSGITHDCVSETTVFRFRSVTIGPPEPLSHLSARLEPMAPWHAHGLAGWYALSDTDTLFVIATKPNETFVGRFSAAVGAHFSGHDEQSWALPHARQGRLHRMSVVFFGP